MDSFNQKPYIRTKIGENNWSPWTMNLSRTIEVNSNENSNDLNIRININNSKVIYLPYNYTDLADYLAIDRSAMYRELKNLKDIFDAELIVFIEELSPIQLRNIGNYLLYHLILHLIL